MFAGSFTACSFGNGAGADRAGIAGGASGRRILALEYRRVLEYHGKEIDNNLLGSFIVAEEVTRDDIPPPHPRAHTRTRTHPAAACWMHAQTGREGDREAGRQAS